MNIFMVVAREGALLIAASMMLSGCWQNSSHIPSNCFMTSASILQDLHEQWIKGGRSSDFNPTNYAGPPGAFFTYTNRVIIDGHAHKCCFGAHERIEPSGMLAITDDGIVIWVRESDGKITVSPELHGVER